MDKKITSTRSKRQLPHSFIQLIVEDLFCFRDQVLGRYKGKQTSAPKGAQSRKKKNENIFLYHGSKYCDRHSGLWDSRKGNN